MTFTQRVAIVTRTKNRAILLRRAIDSVLSQNFQEWTHVIVNDGGDPAPVDQLVDEYRTRYQDRVQVIHNPHSLGMEAASNVGINASRSEYIVIHDDDDSWKPTFLERCVAYLDDPPAALDTPIRGVITHTTRILEHLDEHGVTVKSQEPFNDWMKGVSLYRLAASNCFPPISFVFSRSAMEEVGAFRETLPVLGDWDFHLRFAQRYEIGLIREALANYHHRLQITEGVYGNSVVAGDDKHRRYEHLYRNDLLRADLQAGRIGLGYLVATADGFERVHSQFSILETVISRLSRVRLLRWFINKLG
ncbi:MAG: glycosyltransferase family 2 protein [Rhodocyclaceae bacterium]